MHGRGILTDPYGFIYEGEFEDDAFHGVGRGVYVDGSRYEGEWKRGKMHGHGVYIFPDGGKYEGEFKDGRFHGTGVRTYADSAVHDRGQFIDGKMNGHGVRIFPDGSRYEGAWKHDAYDGRGMLSLEGSWEYVGEPGITSVFCLDNTFLPVFRLGHLEKRLGAVATSRKGGADDTVPEGEQHDQHQDRHNHVVA